MLHLYIFHSHFIDFRVPLSLTHFLFSNHHFLKFDFSVCFTLQQNLSNASYFQQKGLNTPYPYYSGHFWECLFNREHLSINLFDPYYQSYYILIDMILIIFFLLVSYYFGKIFCNFEHFHNHIIDHFVSVVQFIARVIYSLQLQNHHQNLLSLVFILYGNLITFHSIFTLILKWLRLLMETFDFEISIFLISI